MSTVAEIEATAAKLPMKEFEQLLEDLRDLQAVRADQAEMATGQKSVLWEDLKKELDAL